MAEQSQNANHQCIFRWVVAHSKASVNRVKLSGVRVYVMRNRLHADIGRATVVALPEEENHRRWNLTTSQWPTMHAVLHGITRDQFMSRHKANHIQVAYAPDANMADKALAVKAAMFDEMGIMVHICGDVKVG